MNNLIHEDGTLSAWGQGEMDALAGRVDWLSYPGAIPFANDEDLSDQAWVWLTQISQRGNLPLPVSNSGSISTMLARYGVTA